MLKQFAACLSSLHNTLTQRYKMRLVKLREANQLYNIRDDLLYILRSFFLYCVVERYNNEEHNIQATAYQE